MLEAGIEFLFYVQIMFSWTGKKTSLRHYVAERGSCMLLHFGICTIKQRHYIWPAISHERVQETG
jgi:hypothetical protein